MTNYKKFFTKVKRVTATTSKKLKKTVKTKVKQLQNKRKVLDSMTNKELEKVYRNMVKSSVTKDVRDPRTDKLKKVPLKRHEIIRSLMVKVSLDNIISMTPRLRKKALDVEKKLK